MVAPTAEDVQRAYGLPYLPVAVPMLSEAGSGTPVYVAVCFFDKGNPLDAVIKNAEGGFVKAPSPELLRELCLAEAVTHRRQECQAREMLRRVGRALGVNENSIGPASYGWKLSLYGHPIDGIRVRWDAGRTAWAVILDGSETYGWGPSPSAALQDALDSQMRRLRIPLQSFQAFRESLALI